MRLDTINKTMVVIEKELLINRYETSIDQMKYKNVIENEVGLTDEKISTNKLNSMSYRTTNTN